MPGMYVLTHFQRLCFQNLAEPMIFLKFRGNTISLSMEVLLCMHHLKKVQRLLLEYRCLSALCSLSTCILKSIPEFLSRFISPSLLCTFIVVNW